MYPELFQAFGLSITSYGVSKALAAVVAAVLLHREFRRLGWDPEVAVTLVLATAVAGFVGAKLYYLAEHGGSLTAHHFGGSGFTWYGGFLAGMATFAVVVWRHRLPFGTTAAVSVAPLSAAYGVGRLGCLLAGDGTYGRPTDLPWGMAFSEGMPPTFVPVHPTPLYEALAAFLIAGLLWAVRNRWRPALVVGAYAVLTGLARLLVEIVRINDEALFGLTQPQLWSAALMALGIGLVAVAVRQRERAELPSAPLG